MSQGKAVGTALIIGGGIAGLSTAWALNRRGFTVDLFEQGPLPNPRASSYDEHRVTRHAYGEMEGYADLMPDAFRTWETLWRDLGAQHYEAVPAVYFMRGDTPWHPATLRSLARHGIPCREVPLAEVPDRFPMIEPAGLTRVVETGGAGMLFPIRILTDMVVHLAASGVRFHANCRVTEVDPESGSLAADGQRYRGDAVAVCGGAWADRLVPALREDAVPSRQAVLYLAPPPDLAEAWRNAPVLLNLGVDIGTYALPPRRGTRLKVGDHEFTRRGDPDADRLATDADLALLNTAARLTFRDFDRYAVLERKACYYTVTRDERFVVRPYGARGWLVSACSGHGFKLGVLIGEGVAATIAGERPAEALQPWAAGLTPHPASDAAA
jgi:glycine/D-amino acid oxidase-like deaminating enzyme